MSGRDGISIVHVTHRQTPRFDWFADSLARQLAPDDAVEVVFVDERVDRARRAELAEIVRGRFPFRHVLPKPSPYCGPHRLTRRDLFAAASARNTGIVHARERYLVFVDDAAVLMPGWWKEARRAARLGYVVAGAYQKHREMVVEDRVLVSSQVSPSGIDSRWDLASDTALVPIGGGQLFACSFGAPRRLLLDVNGFDEMCDVIGGEDYHLGLRLEWMDATIYYSRAMLTIESEELHAERRKRRMDPQTPQRVGMFLEPSDYLVRLRDFGVDRRSTDGACDSSHMVLDIAYGTLALSRWETTTRSPR